MSKVIEQPATPPAVNDDGWLLDDTNSREKSWVLDEGGAPAEPPAEPPPAEPPVAAPPPGTQPGQGFEYTTATGHTFRGSTPDEAMKLMEGAVIRSATLAAQAQDELARARSSMNDQTAMNRGGTRPQPLPPTEAFDEAKYYQLLADRKPLEAQHYLNQHYYGIEDPRTAFTTSYSVSQKVNDRLEVADFLSRNMDFPNTDQASEALLLRLDRDGLPVTSRNLRMVKEDLFQEGILHPVAAASTSIPAVPAAAPPAAPSRGAGAPPSPRSGGNPPSGDRELTEQELMAMPLEKHKEYLQRRKMI